MLPALPVSAHILPNVNPANGRHIAEYTPDYYALPQVFGFESTQRPRDATRASVLLTNLSNADCRGRLVLCDHHACIDCD